MNKFFDISVEEEYRPNYLFTRCMDINYDGLWTNHHSTFDSIKWKDGVTVPSESEWDSKLAELTAEYDAQEYARKRKAEFPSIQDLVVALYDTDDKADIEAKRAAVKLKYPKPE